MLFMLCGCAVPSQIGDCFGPLLCTEEPPKEKSAGLVRAIVSMDGLVSKSSPSGGKFSASPDSKGLGRVSIAAMSSEDLPLSLSLSRAVAGHVSRLMAGERGWTRSGRPST